MFRIRLETPTPENSHLVKLTQGKHAIVDLDVDPVVWEYKWRAIKWNYRWYAYSTQRRNGTSARIALHRLIASTPSGQVCHHASGNSLDNRIANLMNMTNREHGQLHKIRKWGHASNKRKAKTRQADPIGKPT